MRTIMAKTPHDSSFSFSRRYFHWPSKKNPSSHSFSDDEENDIIINNISDNNKQAQEQEEESILNSLKKQQKNPTTVSKLIATLFFSKPRINYTNTTKVMIGTLFGHRRGHVHVAFQVGPTQAPTFLVELAMPTSLLVREMASGLVRVMLECEKKPQVLDNLHNSKSKSKSKQVRGLLIEEAIWRTYCNGRKCGFASRAECGPEEWKVLRSIGPISMGAGVLPGCGDTTENEGEVMYMRAKFERVVGSKDSEAFYMMNPDGSGGPELSIYLLRS